MRLDYLVNGCCEIGCVGGGNYLVDNHAQLLAFATEAYHGLYEVVAIGRVEPCRAYDYAVGGQCDERCFALALGGSVM